MIFWPKLVLTLVDKVGLGIAAVVFGYWVQKRLEIFKRNQTIVTEITRAHLEGQEPWWGQRGSRGGGEDRWRVAYEPHVGSEEKRFITSRH